MEADEAAWARDCSSHMRPYAFWRVVGIVFVLPCSDAVMCASWMCMCTCSVQPLKPVVMFLCISLFPHWPGMTPDERNAKAAGELRTAVLLGVYPVRVRRHACASTGQSGTSSNMMLRCTALHFICLST